MKIKNQMSNNVMASLPKVFLKPGCERRIKSGHNWLYSNELDTKAAEYPQLSAGDCAEVLTAKGESIGSAYFNPKALLCGRLYDRQLSLLDNDLLSQRIEDALNWRQQCYREPYYRLVYGDGDGLPGLVVDRYGDFLVIQISTAGMMVVKDAVISALVNIVKPEGIVLRTDSALAVEDLEPGASVVYGSVPDVVPLVENGSDFSVPLLSGQKTGWFYDHRDSRHYLKQFVANKRVLDVYSYIGAWGVQALDAGASQVTFVDSSSFALEQAQHNASKAVSGDANFDIVQGQAVDVLKRFAAEGQSYDVIVLDPPAFIKKRKDRRAGEKAYHRINQLAVKLLAEKGLLLSASCSLHLESETLLSIVSTAAHRAGRRVQLLARGGLGPDHPRVPAIAELDYLKAMFFRIE